MIPIKPLDDQYFEDIVTGARRRISRLTSQWTDENLHDPGITMIELLAFLKEMQQYHMDRVPPRNMAKFLHLLGADARKCIAAKTQVWVRNCPGEKRILPGTPLAAGDVIFETLQTETVAPSEIMRVVTLSGDRISVSAETSDVHEAFGPSPQKGDMLWFCLSHPLPILQEISLSVTLSPPKSGRRNPIDEEFIPLSQVAFTYSTPDGWEPLEIITDGTVGFLQSGLIRLRLPSTMVPAGEGPVKGQFAIRCELLRSEFDDIPRLDMVQINMIPVVQKRTYATTLSIDVEQGYRRYFLTHHLALMGECDVFLPGTGGGFVRLYSHESGQNGACYTLQKKSGQPALLLDAVPDCESMRVVLSESGLDAQRLFSGDKLPGQRCELASEGFLLDALLMEEDEDGNYYDYSMVDTFDHSRPHDRHFCWDGQNGELIFGDGVNGRPPSGDVYLVCHERTLGLAGNVKAGEIRRFAPYALPGELSAYTLENTEHVSTGADAQSLDEAMSQFRRNAALPSQAVTLADYEAIAAQTPGLAISRVRALAMAPPGSVSLPDVHAVTVVAQAGGSKGLSPAQRQNILRHVNRFRLVGTQTYVIAPEYIHLQIHCDVRVKTQHLNPEAMIGQAVTDYFSVEWPFGKAVRYADIYGLLDTLDCVSAVRALTLGAQGKGVSINASGDVILPPHGLLICLPCVCRISTR